MTTWSAPVTEPVRRILPWRFDTEAKARKAASGSDYARRFNQLPVLEVEQLPDGQWAVVNPDVNAIAHPARVATTE